MMKYKRYTEKRNGKNVIPLRNAVCGVGLPKWSIEEHSDIQSFLSGEAVDRLAELEDKIEKGTIIELPCKVGDTVYQFDNGGEVYELMILGITIYKNKLYYETIGIDFDNTAIGHSIFLTREEAEKRLKELQE